MNRQKLANILKVLSPNEVNFASFDNEVKKLKEKLTETVTVKTLEDVSVQLERFKKRIDFTPLTSAFESLKEDITIQNNNLLEILNEKQDELLGLIKANSVDDEKISELQAEVSILSARKIEIPDFGKQIKDTEKKLTAIIDTAKTLDTLEDEKEKEQVQEQFAAFEKQIKNLKLQFQARGGGSMNRQIKFNGTDYLTRYTDINYKAGTNVTFTIANNNTTKAVDVTIAASGGGGGGTVRSIATTTVSSTIGEVAATDYVVLANGGVQITLPTAGGGNTNLYTIKNVGTSSVLVATTGGETIDGQTTIIMPVQYTSIDVVSDSVNWGLT